MGDVCHPEAGFRLAAATDYGIFEARELLHALKYRGIRAAAEPISEILSHYLLKLSAYGGLPLRDAVLVPVPLHAKRIRERGYNQSLCIAEALARRLGEHAPHIYEDALRRVRNTKSQADIANRAERELNMQDSFAAENSECVSGKTVLLLDDVSTSGATLRAAARELKRAGARRVIGIVFAKA